VREIIPTRVTKARQRGVILDIFVFTIAAKGVTYKGDLGYIPARIANPRQHGNGVKDL